MSPDGPKQHLLQRALRRLLSNTISLAGVAMVLVSLANIFFLALIDLIAEKSSPYVGILGYMVMPAFLVGGLLLIAIGLWRQHAKKVSEAPEDIPRYPRIDLNDPNQRATVAFFLAFVVVFVLMSAVGSYKAYEFTDSVQFCGQLCHSVMSPEYTAYTLSSHARVACVECHVGAGATWYVKSKLSGVRQVVATVFKTYPRPIPTPVHNLRPAQETCEECHWPKKLYGAQLKVFTHYASDEKNTPRQIRLLIKTGGGDPATGSPSGIHWHMNISNEITYVAADEQRQVIPYVRVKDMEGRVTEYYAKDSKLTKAQIAAAPKHRMDCIDCHNRPTHVYVPPDAAVDRSITAHRIDSSLPFVKQQAVAALTAKYETHDAAMQGIAKSMQDFYESKYPEIAKTKALAVRMAVDETQRIYSDTIFPKMKVDWQTHPNNIGHLYSLGCFRCHDGQHVSAEGKVVSKQCDTCHTVLSQEESGVSVLTEKDQSFHHPIDIGDLTQVNCSDCHTGGVGP
jgi:NapC/NirT cytochrome c family, N-terminal region/Cytochrome c3